MFVMVLKKKPKKKKSGFDKLVDDIKSIINMYRGGKNTCKGKKTCR